MRSHSLWFWCGLSENFVPLPINRKLFPPTHIICLQSFQSLSFCLFWFLNCNIRYCSFVLKPPFLFTLLLLALEKALKDSVLEDWPALCYLFLDKAEDSSDIFTMSHFLLSCQPVYKLSSHFFLYFWFLEFGKSFAPWMSCLCLCTQYFSVHGTETFRKISFLFISNYLGGVFWGTSIFEIMRTSKWVLFVFSKHCLFKHKVALRMIFQSLFP